MIFLERCFKIANIILLPHLLLLSGCYLRYSFEDLNPKNMNQADSNKPTSPTSLEDGIWSNSTSQTPNLTFVSGADSESGIARHEVKIIDHTNTDLDVTNFATFESNNPVTGLTLINGVNYRFAVRAVDNAGNYSTESVSDGWTVDTVAPTTPGAVTIGTVPTVNLGQILLAEKTEQLQVKVQ